MTAPRHEHSDMPASGAALALAGLFASLALILLLVGAMLSWMAPARAPSPPARTAEPPPPRLEVSPRADRARLEAAARARLRGDARHPSIEQAMRAVAAAGWQQVEPAPPTAEVARAHSGAAR